MRLPTFLIIIFICSCKPDTGNNNDVENVNATNIQLESKKRILDSLKVFGKWTEEVWVGVENKNLPPPPPAIIPEHDSIWPPYYEIDKNEIRHYFLGIDSAKYKFDNADVLVMPEGLWTYTIGYQKKWRILNVTDSIMVVERKYSEYYRNAPDHIDGIDTVTFYKKR
ncbi:MAG: hypothetical protein VX798_11515 [Bacteroidota bacterium]|nr:hypothetical protein [Bacteroidota bacterium]